jgi:hypothetical protein
MLNGLLANSTFLVLVALSLHLSGCGPGKHPSSDPSLTALAEFMLKHETIAYHDFPVTSKSKVVRIDPRGMDYAVSYHNNSVLANNSEMEYVLQWRSIKRYHIDAKQGSYFLVINVDPPAALRWYDRRSGSWRSGSIGTVGFGFDNQQDTTSFYLLFRSAAEAHGAPQASIALHFGHNAGLATKRVTDPDVRAPPSRERQARPKR